MQVYVRADLFQCYNSLEKLTEWVDSYTKQHGEPPQFVLVKGEVLRYQLETKTTITLDEVQEDIPNKVENLTLSQQFPLGCKVMPASNGDADDIGVYTDSTGEVVGYSDDEFIEVQWGELRPWTTGWYPKRLKRVS